MIHRMQCLDLRRYNHIQHLHRHAYRWHSKNKRYGEWDNEYDTVIWIKLKNRQLWLYEPVYEVVLLLSFVSFSWSYSPLLLWSLLLSNRWHYYQLDFCLVFSSVVFPHSISYCLEGTEYLPALDHIISLPGHEYIFLDILNCQPFVLRYLENLKINIDFIIIFISPMFTHTFRNSNII